MNFTEIKQTAEEMCDKAIFFIEYSNDFKSFVYEYNAFRTKYGRFVNGWFCESESDLILPNSDTINWTRMTRKEYTSFKELRDKLFDIMRLFNCSDDAVFVTENEEIIIPMYSGIDNSFLGNFKSIADAERVFRSHIHERDYYWVDFIRCSMKMNTKSDNTVFMTVSASEY